MLGDWMSARRNYLRTRALDPDVTDIDDKVGEAERLCRQDEELNAYVEGAVNHGRRKSADPPRMRILMVSIYPPYPPTTGGAVRLFEQIKYFGKRHELIFASYTAGEQPDAIKAAMAEFCECVFIVRPGARIAALDDELPEKIKRWSTYPMWRVLERLSTVPFDVVMFDFVFTAEYRRLFDRHYTVIEEHNIESRLLHQRAATSASDIASTVDGVGESLTGRELTDEAEKLAHYETKTWPLFSLRTAVSDVDRTVIEERIGGAETVVVSNGVDTRRIAPLDLEHSDSILFMGHMAYYPNIDAVHYFANEIFSLILAQIPKASFWIAGRNPGNEVWQLDNRPGVNIIADPEEMALIAEHCALTVVPLRLGSGTRIKILEAMAMGLPVVSTSIGAEGLDVVDGQHLLIRDDPGAFAEACIDLITDRSSRNSLRMNGRLLVKTQYDWEEIFSRYEALLRSRTANAVR